MVWGQSSAARAADTGQVELSTSIFNIYRTISTISTLSLQMASAVDFSATASVSRTLEMEAGDGAAVRVDFIGGGNTGYIASSKNLVRTFMSIRQVGWSES